MGPENRVSLLPGLLFLILPVYSYDLLQIAIYYSNSEGLLLSCIPHFQLLPYKDTVINSKGFSVGYPDHGMIPRYFTIIKGVAASITIPHPAMVHCYSVMYSYIP